MLVGAAVGTAGTKAFPRENPVVFKAVVVCPELKAGAAVVGAVLPREKDTEEAGVARPAPVAAGAGVVVAVPPTLKLTPVV